METPWKFLRRLKIDLLIQQFHFWVYIQREWKQDFNEIPTLPCNDYYSFIHNSQHMETIKCSSMDDWVKRGVLCTHNGLFDPKKNIVICNSMDGPWTHWASLVAQMVKRLPAMWETQVQPLGWEDPLEKEMATLSSTLTWKIAQTEEPRRL